MLRIWKRSKRDTESRAAWKHIKRDVSIKTGTQLCDCLWRHIAERQWAQLHFTDRTGYYTCITRTPVTSPTHPTETDHSIHHRIKCEWWKTNSQDIETCCAYTCTPPVFVCGGLSITGANHLSASPDGSTEACGNDEHTRLLLTTDIHIQYTHSHNLYLLLFNHTIQKGYMASLFYVYSDHAVNKGQ